MAGEDLDASSGDRASFTAGGWLASAGAVLATLLLLALVAMVTLSNRARDEALAFERHSYDVMLLTRTVDGTVARAEAALGRYVLDEEQQTGSLYYAEWRLAAQQIGALERLVRDAPGQRARVTELRRLFQSRGQELARAAGAARARRGAEGINLFYQAGMSKLGPELRANLASIAADERDDLRRRMTATRISGNRAHELTEWLGWLALFIAFGAVVAGFLAYRAVNERLAALRQAHSEADRAQQLEQAVQARTRELVEANARLQEEGIERAAAEAQLRQVQKMEAVGQLTGGIAHDFNNMLAVVVGGLDLARRRLAGSRSEVEAHLDNAMEGATRAAALTRRLLAFARSEQLLPTNIAPAALVSGMLELVDRSIGERITVETRLPKSGWNVRVDSSQLESAILNLAVNARDAMEGEGRLTIAVEDVAVAAGQLGELAPGDYVRISVADTGSGIAPEHMERVFEPFFTTKEVGKGTGLGLSQIFGFARQSGGDVMIESEQGRGTTVSIYLPRTYAQAEAEGELAAESGPAAPAPTGTAILVVEDDPRVSRATIGALEELGYRPRACASGREALHILAREPGVELLITDVMMPEMTGPELVRQASALYPWIAVLFVTGYVGEAGEAEDLSGYQMLRKPFTVAALAAAVSEALARKLSESPPASKAAAAAR
jgi:signal transduction histidine kinase/CheY-like chemotaxis protein